RPTLGSYVGSQRLCGVVKRVRRDHLVEITGKKDVAVVLFICPNILVRQMMVTNALRQRWVEVANHEKSAVGKNSIDLGDGPQQCGPIHPVQHKIYNDQIKPRLRVKRQFRSGAAQEPNSRKLCLPVLNRLVRWLHCSGTAAEASGNFVQAPPITGADLEY